MNSIVRTKTDQNIRLKQNVQFAIKFYSIAVTLGKSFQLITKQQWQFIVIRAQRFSLMNSIRTGRDWKNKSIIVDEKFRLSKSNWRWFLLVNVSKKYEVKY